jgi:hypothetical protein
MSTTLAAGPVKSNGAGAFISQAIALGGAEVSGTLAGNGGTGAVSFTSGGLLRGNNVGALSVASAADIVAAIGATFVTNATNATNATNTVNVGVTNDAATATPVFFILGKCCFKISLPKFQVLIYLLFLLLVFYQQQDSQEMVLH